MYRDAMYDLPPVWPSIIRGAMSGLVIGLVLIGLLHLGG